MVKACTKFSQNIHAKCLIYDNNIEVFQYFMHHTLMQNEESSNICEA